MTNNSKAVSVFEPERPAMSATEDMLNWIRSLEIALPQLTRATLEAEAKAHKLSAFSYLRRAAGKAHPELAEMSKKTKSEEIKNAIQTRVRSAIVSNYPFLAEQLPTTWAAPVIPAVPAEMPKPVKPAPTITLAEAKAQAAEDAEGDLNQIGNAQLAALRLVHDYVIPAAAAEGITVDATQASGLVMNAIIQTFHQRSHFKLSRTRIETA
jgi:hypothetical protein